MIAMPLSLAVLLAASASFGTLAEIASPDLEAICADEDKSLSQVSLLQVSRSHAIRPAPKPTNLQEALEYRDYYSPGSRLTGHHSVPSFEVNLDEAPESRWKNVLDHYLETGLMQASIEHGRLDPSTKLPESYRPAWIAAIKAEVGEEYIKEAAGMAAYINNFDPSMAQTVDDILLQQYGYEQNYPEFCSGVIAAMKDGTVIHGRNMDYQLSLLWKNKTIGWPEFTTEVIFSRGGKPLYTSVTWPLQLGIHTAMRFGGWTFEQNTRRLGNDMKEDLAALEQGGKGFSLFARRLMEQVPDFETAMQTLWKTSWAAPQYFIMAGAKPFEGAVLSLDRLGQHLPDSPPLLRLTQNASSWHIVQTNEDLNKPPTNPRDIRRRVEELRLSESEQSLVSETWMLDHMRRFPVMNKDTVFTWMSIPATDYFQTILPPGSIDPLDPTQ